MSQADLIMRAAAVARRCPTEWSDFVAQFRAYTDQARQTCVSSPAEAVFVAQGHARECASLLRLFEECLKRADQIQEKRK